MPLRSATAMVLLALAPCAAQAADSAPVTICLQVADEARAITALGKWMRGASLARADEGPCRTPTAHTYGCEIEWRTQRPVVVLRPLRGKPLERALPWLTASDHPISRLAAQGRLSDLSLLLESLVAEARLSEPAKASVAPPKVSRTPPPASGTAPTSSGTASTSSGTAPTSSGTAPESSWTAPTPSWTPPTSSWTPPTSSWTPPTPSWTSQTTAPPVPDAPAPVPDAPPPVQDEPPPVQDEPARVQDEPAPVQDEPAPVQDEPAPVPFDSPPGPLWSVSLQAGRRVRPVASSTSLGLSLGWNQLRVELHDERTTQWSLESRPLSLDALALDLVWQPHFGRGRWSVEPRLLLEGERVTVQRLDLPSAAQHAMFDASLGAGAAFAMDVGAGLRLEVIADGLWSPAGAQVQVPEGPTRRVNGLGLRVGIGLGGRWPAQVSHDE